MPPRASAETPRPAPQREPAVDRVLKFVAALVCEPPPPGGEEAMGSFCEAVLERLLPLFTVGDKGVRSRATELVAAIMNSLPADTELSEELLESVAAAAKGRLRDRAPAVRGQAARILARVQARRGEEQN